MEDVDEDDVLSKLRLAEKDDDDKGLQG